MTRSDQIAQLAAAMAKAQPAIAPAIKDAANPFFKSKYADLGEVWRVIQAAFAPHGLSVLQVPETAEDGSVTLTTMVLHESGEWIAGTMPVRVVKDDPQGVGSGITYARRYALSAMCGVVAEDDDGEAAMGRGNGNGHQQAAPPTREKTIGNDGSAKLATLCAQVAEATGYERRSLLATVKEMAVKFGHEKVADMTIAEGKQVEEYLKTIEPASEPDIFGGEDAGTAARLQPTTGGE